MTTEERLEKLEQELARAKRRNRWLLAGAVLCLGIVALAWAFGPVKALAQAGKPVADKDRPVSLAAAYKPGLQGGVGRAEV